MLAARRRDRPHPARQQQRATARTTSSPGWTGSSSETQNELLAFTQRLIALRREHPVFRRRRFFTGEAAPGRAQRRRRHRLVHPGRHADEPRRTGTNGYARAVEVFLNGERDRSSPDKRGQQVLDDSFLIVFNAHYEDIEFTMPPAEYGTWWSRGRSTPRTTTASGIEGGDTFAPGDRARRRVPLAGRAAPPARRAGDTTCPLAAATTDAERARAVPRAPTRRRCRAASGGRAAAAAARARCPGPQLRAAARGPAPPRRVPDELAAGRRGPGRTGALTRPGQHA